MAGVFLGFFFSAGKRAGRVPVVNVIAKIADGLRRTFHFTPPPVPEAAAPSDPLAEAAMAVSEARSAVESAEKNLRLFRLRHCALVNGRLSYVADAVDAREQLDAEHRRLLEALNATSRVFQCRLQRFGDLELLRRQDR